jgi:hypothetical protein
LVKKARREGMTALPTSQRRALNEELASVLASKGSKLLHLGLTRRAFRRGRQGALLRWLARGVDELLEARRRE